MDFFCIFVILFFLYSFIGYLFEVLSCSLIDHQFTFSRGYLIGPYLPIFGFGAMIMIFVLGKYQDDLLALFILSIVFSCLLEYFTSYLLERIFKLRWWDYSSKMLNINGRVSLETGVLFGISGIVIVRYVQPFFMRILSSFPSIFLFFLGIFFFLLLFVDFIVSTFMISKLKIDANKFTSKDTTSIVRKEIIASLQKNRILYQRFFHAFPNFSEHSMFVPLRKYLEEKNHK